MLFSQINNAEMVDTQAEETTIKAQAIIVYKFMMVQEILLISNDHTTPYPESQKKMRHSFIFTAGFSNSYISYHKTGCKFPLQD
jgi:hypothetical protein